MVVLKKLPVLPSVRARVILGVTPHLDGEELGPIAAVQLLEAVHRHPRRPRDKLQQTCSHLVGEGQHHLECIPSVCTIRLTATKEIKSEKVLEHCVYTLYSHKQLSLSQRGKHLYTYPPEPLYDYVVGMVLSLVNSVGSPVLYIDGHNTTHQELKFMLRKKGI